MSSTAWGAGFTGRQAGGGQPLPDRRPPPHTDCRRTSERRHRRYGLNCLIRFRTPGHLTRLPHESQERAPHHLLRWAKVGVPTPREGRFSRSQPCDGGAGGTRTHGRRIMSPLRIFRLRPDLALIFPFQQVSGVQPFGPARGLPGPSGSFRPLRVHSGCTTSHPRRPLGPRRRQVCRQGLVPHGFRRAEQRSALPAKRGLALWPEGGAPHVFAGGCARARLRARCGAISWPFD